MLAGRFREVAKKAYLYSRVSSTGQIDGNGIDRQDERGLEYCNRLIVPTGMPLDSDVRCDKGRSAFKGRLYNGSKVVDPGKIVKIPERVASVREASRLASLGVGCKHIARQIDWCLSLSWLIRTLQNRAVLGEYVPCKMVDGKNIQDGDAKQNYYPVIVTQNRPHACN